MPGVPDHPEEATMTTAPRSDAPTALPDDGRTVSVLVYSDNRAIRERVVSGLGRRPAPDVPRVRILECATPPAVIGAFDAGQVDVAVLDGEAAPAGGMGICRQMKDEIYRCPPILVLTGRLADNWLAAWSRADAVVPHPVDPFVLAESVARLIRTRLASLPATR
jgi:CheY-like chemotaxis protein